MALGWDGLERCQDQRLDGTATLHSVPTALNAMSIMSLMPSKVLPEYLFPLFPGN